MPKKKRGKTRATKMSAAELGNVGHSDINLEALQQSLRDAVTVMAPRGSAHHAESEEMADELRPAAHRVCRHMLDGGCFRSDCPFSHDVSGVPCRYFGTPMGCRNGPSCPFLHHKSAIRTPTGPASSAAPQQPQAAAGTHEYNSMPDPMANFGTWPMQVPEQVGAQWDFVSGVTPFPVAASAGLTAPAASSSSPPVLPKAPVDWSRKTSEVSVAAAVAHAPPPSVAAALASAAESSAPWDGPALPSSDAGHSAQTQWGQPSAEISVQRAAAGTWGSPEGVSSALSAASEAVSATAQHDGRDSAADQWGQPADDGISADDLVLDEEDTLPFEGDDLDWLLQMAADATDAAQAAKAAGGAGGGAELASSQLQPPSLAPPSEPAQRGGASSRPAPRIFLGPIPDWVVQDVEDMGGVQSSAPTAADFPVLGGGRGQGAVAAGRSSEGTGGGSAWAGGGSSGDAAHDGTRLSLSDQLKLQWLVDAVAQGMKDGGINDPRRGDSTVVLAAFLDCGRDLEAARLALQQQLQITIAVQRADKVQAETYAAYERFGGGTAGMTAEARQAAAAAAKRLKWVDTGVGVSMTYKSARADAERFAVARNRCFGRATEAYLGGKGAAARAWSKEGRTWDAKMRQAHARAAATIFAQRNAAMGGNDGLLSVDVHGLHPDEAVRVTENAMRNAGAAQWLAVIMGTGHHSSGPRSVLVDELKRWAERTHVSWFEGGAGAGQGGVMMIQLTR